MPDTLKQVVNRVKAAKTAIGNAITAKGGTVGANDGLEEFAADIATIPSGGGSDNAEFSNTPSSFSMGTNLVSCNIPDGITSFASSGTFKSYNSLRKVEIPGTMSTLASETFRGCTALTDVILNAGLQVINDYAFDGCTSLQHIEIPLTVNNIKQYAFVNCNGLTNINLYNVENAVTGAPWGAPGNPNINWLRRNNYQSSCTEVASGTTLTGTVNATVGDLVVATFVIRGNTYTIDSGWTLLGISEMVGVANQRTAMAYKTATSSSESLTVTQDTTGRIYINLVSITGASVGTFSGFTTQETGQSITMTKPQGLVIWGVSASAWGTTPYSLWGVSDEIDVTAIQLPNTTQPRCLTALDQSNNASETFRYSPGQSGDGELAAASLTITGIDNFWHYDEPQT